MSDVDERVLRLAALAADGWALNHASEPMSAADRTRGVVRTAITHLIEQGLLIVPDDLDARLNEPVPMWRQPDVEMMKARRG